MCAFSRVLKNLQSKYKENNLNKYISEDGNKEIKYFPLRSNSNELGCACVTNQMPTRWERTTNKVTGPYFCICIYMHINICAYISPFCIITMQTLSIKYMK